MRTLATQYPGIFSPYVARVNARGGPTGLFSLAPNPVLSCLADLPIRVPFNSVIGNRGKTKELIALTASFRIEAHI